MVSIIDKYAGRNVDLDGSSLPSGGSASELVWSGLPLLIKKRKAERFYGAGAGDVMMTPVGAGAARVRVAARQR